MSSTEDCELQELVKQTLEKTGSLSKIRAELRANVFLALEETGCFEGTNSKNPELQNFFQNTNGALVLHLIQEFLECFGLSFTKSVLDPELTSYGVHCSWKSRAELMKQLNVPADMSDENKLPLIYLILQQFRRRQNSVPNSNSHVSTDEKVNPCWTNNSLLTYTTEYSDASIDPISSKKNEPMHVTFDENEEHKNTTPLQSSSMTDNEERIEIMKSPSTSGKDTFAADLHNPNTSLLGELPPLSTPTNSSRSGGPNVANKSSKQMNKLKAMLKDSSCETTNASNITEDELLNSTDQEDMSGSENMDEELIREIFEG